MLAVGTAQEVPVPPKATRIDGKGLSLTAGLTELPRALHWPECGDAKTAPREKLAAAMERMLNRYGFTTVVDAGSYLANTVALRVRVETADVPGPRILTAGEPLYPKGGVPIYVRESLPADILAQLFQPATPEKARAEVEQNLAHGADMTKLFAGSWLGDNKTVEMPLDVIRAAAEATHQAHKQVLAHPQTLEGVRRSLEGGVDVLMHTTPDAGPWPPELVFRLVAAHMALVPTLGLWTVVAHEAAMTPAHVESFVQGGVAQLRAFAKAGGEVLFGTDVGFHHATDTGEELVRMAQPAWAGVTSWPR